MTTPHPPLVPKLPETGNVWRTAELHELGFSSRSIRLLLGERRLVRLRYGCYIRAPLWDQQSPGSRSKQLILARAHGTLTTSTGNFVYSHTSAARLHGLFLWDVDDLIHILLQICPSNERLGHDVRGHTRPFREDDVVTIGKLRVTSLERTVVDCAMMLNYRQALVLVDHALRRGAEPARLEAMALSCQVAAASEPPDVVGQRRPEIGVRR